MRTGGVDEEDAFEKTGRAGEPEWEKGEMKYRVEAGIHKEKFREIIERNMAWLGSSLG